MAHRRDLLGGGALLVIGVILLLRTLGYIPADLDLWWPVILILIGLAIVFNRARATAGGPEGTGIGAPLPRPPGITEERRRAPTGGLILIGLGLALLVGNLLGGRATGALILIAVGLVILVGRIWWGPSP